MTENLFLKNNLCRFVFLSVLICVLIPAWVEAMVLYLEPESKECQLGDVFVAKIKINTEGEDINAIKVDLTFSQDVLEIKDFSQGGSILVLWPESPGFSNQSGRIYFTGGIPGGFSREDGLLGKLVFRAKKEGKALVQIEETSQVLLNDGLGTLAELKTKGGLFSVFAERREIPEDEWRKELEKDDILPEPFEITIYQDPFLFEGKYFIVFFTVDKQTGIDYYEVKEGERDWKRGESPYLLENQNLKSIIKVKAVDKAGNERIAEYLPAKKPTPYLIIILVLIGLGVIYWIIRKLKVKK